MMKERQLLFESGGAVCRDGTAAHDVVGKLKRGAVCGAQSRALIHRAAQFRLVSMNSCGELQVKVNEVTHYSDSLLNLDIH